MLDVSKKFLIVYCTCGASGKNNRTYYKKALESLANQKKDKGDFQIAISSCFNSEKDKELFRDFKKNNNKCPTTLHFIDDLVTLNVSFNYTVQKCVETFGEFAAYVYCDSGVSLENNYDVVNRFYSSLEQEQYGMVTPMPSSDSGISWWFKGGLPSTGDFVLPVGKAINPHFHLFHRDLYRAYNGKLFADIFRAHSTETIWTFQCSAIKKRWLFMQTLTVHHEGSMDGPSSLWGDPFGWEHTFHAPRSMRDIREIARRECPAMGLEECGNILMHDPSYYDKNQIYKGGSELKDFILEHFFLKEKDFPYSKIKHEFYE